MRWCSNWLPASLTIYLHDRETEPNGSVSNLSVRLLTNWHAMIFFFFWNLGGQLAFKDKCNWEIGSLQHPFDLNVVQQVNCNTPFPPNFLNMDYHFLCHICTCKTQANSSPFEFIRDFVAFTRFHFLRRHHVQPSIVMVAVVIVVVIIGTNIIDCSMSVHGNGRVRNPRQLKFTTAISFGNRTQRSTRGWTCFSGVTRRVIVWY